MTTPPTPPAPTIVDLMLKAMPELASHYSRASLEVRCKIFLERLLQAGRLEKHFSE